MPNVSNSRPVLKFILWMFALASIIFAVAQPQFGSKLKTEKRNGVELIIALDVSQLDDGGRYSTQPLGTGEKSYLPLSRQFG